MNVIFDISAVSVPGQRSGLSRYAISLAERLGQSPRCQVHFSATGSLLGQQMALQYLAENPGIGGNAMAPSPLGMAMLRWAQARQAGGSGLDHATAKVLWQTLRVHNLLRHPVDPAALQSAQVFHSAYALLPRQVRQARWLQPVITVMDLIPVLFPELVNPFQIPALMRIIRSITPRSWIICISQCTKNDLCARFGFDPARMFVTPLAADTEIFRPCQDAQAIVGVRQRYGIGETPYVLSLATVTPHKNMGFLLEAFARLVRQQPDCDLKLVLAGGKGATAERIQAMLNTDATLAPRVVLTGYVAESDLRALYGGAMMFAFPSLYEGFGLPPLEAMQCRVPVVCSNRSSLPEVIGDGGMLLDPTDTDAWGDALWQLWRDQPRRQALAEKALARAGQFSWRRTADLTLDVYQRITN